MADLPTLLDIARARDPDGSPAKIIEVMAQNNPILQHAPAYPSNMDMGELVTRESALPTVGWGKLNKGITRSKGADTQVTESIGLLEARAEIDARHLHIVGKENFDAKRFNESKKFIRALSNELAENIFYGNEKNGIAQFTGFQPRLETAATAKSGSQVRKHHASPSGSDYASIYVADWGEEGCHLIFPKHGVAGIDTDDLGKIQIKDRDGNEFTGYAMDYHWWIGLCVKDPRHMARLCNIDVSQALADTSVLITKSLIPMMNSMPSKAGFRRVMYCPTDIKTAFELQVNATSNVWFTLNEFLGEKMLHFRGVPIFDCDALSVAESLVS